MGSLILLTILYSGLILLIQRAESKRRLLVAIVLLPILLSIHSHMSNNDLNSESTTALILAVVSNTLFWLVIGRYNPVGSSDDIKVIGMDD